MAYAAGIEFEAECGSGEITMDRRKALALGAGALLGGGALFRRNFSNKSPEPVRPAVGTDIEDSNETDQNATTEEDFALDEVAFVEQSFKLDTVVGPETYRGRMSAERLRELIEDEESEEFDKLFSITKENVAVPEFLPATFAYCFDTALLTGQSPTEIDGRFDEAVLSGDSNLLDIAIESYLDEMADKYDRRINAVMFRVSESAPTFTILTETLRAARRRFVEHACLQQNLREAASMYVVDPQVTVRKTGRIVAEMNVRFTNFRDENDPEAYDIEEPASITSILDEKTGFYTTMISDMPEDRRAFEKFSNL